MNTVLVTERPFALELAGVCVDYGDLRAGLAIKCLVNDDELPIGREVKSDGFSGVVGLPKLLSLGGTYGPAAFPADGDARRVRGYRHGIDPLRQTGRVSLVARFRIPNRQMVPAAARGQAAGSHPRAIRGNRQLNDWPGAFQFLRS